LCPFLYFFYNVFVEIQFSFTFIPLTYALATIVVIIWNFQLSSTLKGASLALQDECMNDWIENGK